MKITIRGNAKHLPKRLIRKAVTFFGSQLMKPALLKKIHVHIVFNSGLGDAHALVTQEDKHSFEIEISPNMSGSVTLHCLAHEMTHVMQYATGIMRDYQRSDCVNWRGQKIAFNENDPSYWLMPWEIEARGYEVGLCELLSHT